MNLWVRLIWLLATVRFRSRLGVLETGVRKFMVWPNDLDLNFHMNNGRFLTIMDLGRFDLTFRTGLGALMWKRRWRPVVGSARIRFRRSLDPFQRFELHTRLLAWDEKWLYLEQRFMREGDLYAEALVKAVFKDGKETVPPRVLAAALGLPEDSPSQPPSMG